MKTLQLGTRSVRIPAIGQGTWDIERADRGQAIAALVRGIELGMTHIDTAEMYGDGEAERIVGEALRSMGDGARERVFIASKVLPQNATRAKTIAACERSLERLGTDYLDLYLLHWRESLPLSGTIDAFEELVERGWIRHWGVSNFDEDDLDDLLEVAEGGRCVCNQVLYHLQERAIEHRVLPKCEDLGITVVGYSPFGHGSSSFPTPDSKKGRELAEIAAAHGVTPRQGALAFLTRLPSLAAIPKSARIEHVEENARAGELELTPQEIERIDAVFPKGKPRALPTA